MGTTYSHTSNTFVSDQSFINDVGTVLRDRLQWNGNSLTPNTVNDIIFTKDPGYGIKVDPGNSSFTWVDLLGFINLDPAGAGNRPTFTVYRQGIKEFQFAVNDQTWITYHVPHDYVPNTQIFVHVHWSHVVGSVTGNVVWGVEATYAKGHKQQAFGVTSNVFITGNTSGIAFQHELDEVPLSGNGLPIVTSSLEPDGVILLRVYLSQNNTAPLTAPFLHFCDLHYQSSGIGTKSKAPNFYQ